MKTTHIEEILEQTHAMLDGEIHEKCLYYTYITLKDNIALIDQALTEAHQAGYADGYKQGKLEQ